jgi:hypothetical protein
MSALFLPGWGARASIYRTAVPDVWEVLEPPSFRATRGSLEAYSTWLGTRARPPPGRSRRRPRSALHSPSSPRALVRSIEAARARRSRRPPLSKPMRLCLRDFGRQLATGVARWCRRCRRQLGSRRAACQRSGSLVRSMRSTSGRARRAPRPWAADDGARRRRRHALLRLHTAAPRRRLSQAPSTGSSTSPAGHVWFLVAAPRLRRRLALCTGGLVNQAVSSRYAVARNR